MPPNRRTQCATSTRAAGHRDQHRHRPLPGSRAGQRRSRGQRDEPGRNDPRRLAARHLAPSVLPCGRRHRPAARQRRRRLGPPITATITAIALDSANARPCTTIATTTAATPNGPAEPSRITAAPAAGARSSPAPSAVSARPVDVQAAGRQQQRRHRQHAGQRAVRTERLRAGPQHRRGQRAQRHADHRQRRQRAAADRGSRARGRQNRAERESRCQRTDHDDRPVGRRRPRRTSPSTHSVATAARSTGSATTAPVPSPSRMRRSTIGSSSERRQGQRVAGFGGPMAGLPPVPRARRQPLGDQRRGRHHHAVEQQRGAPHRGLRAEAGHRGQVGAAAACAAARPDRPTDRRARNSASRTAAVLRAQPASSMPVPRPTTATGSVSVSAATSAVAGGGVSDAHVAGDQQVGAGVDLLVGDPAAGLDRGDASRRPVSASSTAMLPLPRRTLCAPIAADSGSSTSTAMSATRTVAPARSASTLIAAPPASMLATICAVTSGGIGRHPGGGHAVVTGEHHHPGALELPAAGTCPGTPPPRPTGPRAGPAHRAAWSACPGARGPRAATSGSGGETAAKSVMTAP